MKEVACMIQKLQQIIDQSQNIVFFGGAGVSTESGIPDFRSQDGLYHTEYDYPPETILSYSFFCDHPEEFFRFYRNKIVIPQAQPNAAHKKLVELEEKGKLKAIITQNIDGLHYRAGSKNVYELHGSIYRNYCRNCQKSFNIEAIIESAGIPYCDCGGIIKPDVVLYEEGLNAQVINKSVKAIAQADLLIIGGTSLAVYPAAGFIDYFRGDKLVLINKSKTPLDSQADLVIHDSIGKVLGAILVGKNKSN